MDKKKTLFIGFASQKGGVGKSSLAEIVSSILYYEKGFSIAVIDCDGTQESFLKLRERERDVIENNTDISKLLENHFKLFGKPAYNIIRTTPEEAILDVNLFLEKRRDIEIVLFDFPGHSSTKALLELSMEMDYIISPIEADVQSLSSCLAYATTIRDMGG